MSSSRRTFVEPGEAHELNEKVTIRVASEKDPDCSDSEWRRQLQHVCEAETLAVVCPLQEHARGHSDTHPLDRNVTHERHSGQRRRRRRRRRGQIVNRKATAESPEEIVWGPPSKAPRLPPIFNRPAAVTDHEGATSRRNSPRAPSVRSPSRTGSRVSWSTSRRRTRPGIDLEDARLTVETASDTDRKLSSASAAGILITVEPEGKSVTYEGAGIRVLLDNNLGSDGGRAGRGLELSHVPITEEEDEGTLESGGASIVKTKRQRQRSNHKHRSKCKIS